MRQKEMPPLCQSAALLHCTRPRHHTGGGVTPVYLESLYEAFSGRRRADLDTILKVANALG
jgi:hypothetical protein